MDLETVEVLNTFSGNNLEKKILKLAKNLEINQYSNFDPVMNNVKDSTLRAILKYKDHPSILALLRKKFITLK